MYRNIIYRNICIYKKIVTFLLFSFSFLSFIVIIFEYTEFKAERRILLEVIGPELQSIYDDRQIEVKIFFPIPPPPPSFISHFYLKSIYSIPFSCVSLLSSVVELVSGKSKAFE